MAGRYVAADPYPWPFDGDLRPENTALIVIDRQIDFCGIGGYVDRMGYDLSLTWRADRANRGGARTNAPRWLSCVPHPRGPPAGPCRSAGEQALALTAHRLRHRRSRSM